MQNILEIRNLKVNFHLQKQVVTAVESVNLHIKRDEVLLLAGESGSGKTVTSLAITRILPVTARIVRGEIILDGQDTLKLDGARLRMVRGAKVAYIFQEPTSFLNPVYNIGNQILEAIMLHQHKNRQEASNIAVELLGQVRIKDPERVMFDYPHQLSGGMNQRVFLAMALACRPKLLIADEPTTALDVTTEAEILQLLLDLKEKMGFSLLFITHNLSIARRIADRICVMYKGRVVEEGAKDKVFSHPEHSHSRELIAAYNKIGKV